MEKYKIRAVFVIIVDIIRTITHVYNLVRKAILLLLLIKFGENCELWGEFFFYLLTAYKHINFLTLHICLLLNILYMKMKLFTVFYILTLKGQCHKKSLL